MKNNYTSASMEKQIKGMADNDSFELSDDMLDAVSGGELDEMQKNDLFFAARMFKGMCNDNIDLFFELNRDLNLSEEAIACCREIWPAA